MAFLPPLLPQELRSFQDFCVLNADGGGNRWCGSSVFLQFRNGRSPLLWRYLQSIGQRGHYMGWNCRKTLGGKIQQLSILLRCKASRSKLPVKAKNKLAAHSIHIGSFGQGRFITDRSNAAQPAVKSGSKLVPISPAWLGKFSISRILRL